MQRFTHAVLPFRLRALSAALAAGSAVFATSVAAQAPVASTQRNYDLPAGSLATTLNRIAVEAGLALSVEPALVEGRRSHSVRGRFDAETALREALRDSGLQLQPTSAGSFTLAPLPEGAVMLQKVKVEGRSPFDPPPEPVGMKADYQSSATKSTLSIRETPQAITVVTRESMDRRQVRDLTSALELTAGLVPASSSTIGGPFAGRGLEMNEQFSLRGQDLNGQRDMRVDGFALSSPELDLVLFDRVEVVKGPSSMLYGQGSLGGFINFIRKKPQAEARTSVVGQIGSWDTYRAELDTTGTLTENGELRGRLVAAYDDSGSFIDGVWTKSTVLAPNVDWQINDKTQLYLDLIYQDSDFRPSHGVPLRVDGDKLHMPDIPRSRMTGEPPSTDSYSDSRIATARVDHQLNDDWLVTLALQGGNQKFGRFFDNYAHGGLDEFGDTNLYADTYTTDDDFWATELRVDGRFEAFGREHQVLMGLERNRRTYESTFAYQLVGVGNIYTNEYPSDGTRAVDLDADSWSGFTENAGAYAQFIFGISDRMKILAGLRYDETEQTTDADDATKDDVTTRVGLTYDLSSNLTTYAAYGESFSPVEEQTYDHKLLDPKTGESFEVGLKSDWFDGRLGVTLALFRQELNNVPIPDPAHPDGSISGGEQRNDGVEIEVSGSPMPGLEIVAGYGWVDSEYTDRADPEYGLVPYGTIEENGGISVSYELQEGMLRGLGAGFTYTYVGTRSFAYAGLVDQGYVTGATSDQLWFDGFERTDFNFFYTALENWDLSLQVRNVFDDTYIERMRDIESNNYFGSPRAYLLRAEYSF